MSEVKRYFFNIHNYEYEEAGDDDSVNPAECVLIQDHQSAIDRLTAERDELQRKYDELTGERFSDRVHAALKSRTERAEAERDAASADAERYRKIESLAAGTPEQWQAVEDAAFASHWGCIQNFAINIDAIADMKEQEQGK